MGGWRPTRFATATSCLTTTTTTKVHTAGDSVERNMEGQREEGKGKGPDIVIHLHPIQHPTTTTIESIYSWLQLVVFLPFLT